MALPKGRSLAGPLITLLTLAALAGAAVAAPSAPSVQSDVRVLIDISGSMRQNDPQNLRRPALRMLSGLLQPGTQAGVWTFAKWVNNLVPVAPVDAAWKQRTQSLSEQIGSPGQFTNIELVLDQASADWTGQDPQGARHLILLTDGMVDVAKDDDANAASRARILNELLPRLIATEVKVHTIALSARADHALMQRLSGDTGGWYQQVERADELQRVFLRMFEQVGKPDALPLEDNRFTVDGAVEEATVLAFSRPGSAPAELVSPSGEVYRDSDLVAGVAWFRDQGYDMITIASPEKGEWQLRADLDPDNRVLIVTDLKLQVSEVPTHFAAGEASRIEANLSNRGKVVSRQAFLRLLDVRADLDGATEVAPPVLNDAGDGADTEAGDGRYTMRLEVPGRAGELELVVAVESPTFTRQKRFHLVVHEPLEAAFEDGADGPLLAVRLNNAVMAPGATLEAWQAPTDAERRPLEPAPLDQGNWLVAPAETGVPSYLRVAGSTRLGNLIDRTLGPYVPEGVTLPEPPPAPEPVPEAAPEAAPAEVVESAPEPAPEPEVAPATELEPEPEETAGWVLPAIVFGGFNLVLLVGGGVGYMLWRRRRKVADDDLADLVEQATGGDAQETPA